MGRWNEPHGLLSIPEMDRAMSVYSVRFWSIPGIFSPVRLAYCLTALGIAMILLKIRIFTTAMLFSRIDSQTR